MNDAIIGPLVPIGSFPRFFHPVASLCSLKKTSLNLNWCKNPQLILSLSSLPASVSSMPATIKIILRHTSFKVFYISISMYIYIYIYACISIYFREIESVCQHRATLLNDFYLNFVYHCHKCCSYVLIVICNVHPSIYIYTRITCYGCSVYSCTFISISIYIIQSFNVHPVRFDQDETYHTSLYIGYSCLRIQTKQVDIVVRDASTTYIDI
jgi:hypothetical protein